MVESSDFLEDKFHDLPEGARTSIVAKVLIHCPGAHVCESAIHHQIFLTNAPIERFTSLLTLFEVRHVKGRKTWLDFDDSSYMLPHAAPSVEKLSQVVEGCAGIGAVDVGYRFLGAESILFIEQNPVYCKWLTDRYQAEVIQGDISDPRVAMEVAKKTGSGIVLSAGISCQPFSYMGDQGEERDERSKSCTGVLKLSHLLQAIVTVLECTKGAQESAWVQEKLQTISQCTGCSIHQKVLAMHHIWPGKRDRWWCVLGSKHLMLEDFPEMPSFRFDPFILHLFHGMLDSNNPAYADLILDDEELNAFATHGKGVHAHRVDMCKHMPTATHSWGSQAVGCRCGCRRAGFTFHRLASKGIYGQLVPFEDAKQPQSNFLRARHMHPIEVAILCGLPPSYLQTSEHSDLRLDLSGIGQCASPLQSLWVFANVIYQLHHRGMIQHAEHPRRALANFCRVLLHERTINWPDANTKYTRIFENEIFSLDHPFVFASPDSQSEYPDPPDHASEFPTEASAAANETTHCKASDFLEPSEGSTDDATPVASVIGPIGAIKKEETNSQRTGRKDLRPKELDQENTNSQRTGRKDLENVQETPEAEKENSQRAGRKNLHSQDPIGTEAPLRPMLFHAMPDECTPDAPGPAHPQSRHVDTQKVVSLSEQPNTTTHASASARKPRGKGGTFADQPCQATIESASIDKASENSMTFTTTGGVVGFETSPVHRPVTQKLVSIPPSTPAPDSMPIMKRSADSTETSDQKRLKTNHDTPEPSIPLTEVPQQISSDEPSTPLIQHVQAWVCHEGEPYHQIHVTFGTTVGQLTCAEAKLHDTWDHGEHPFRPVDGVGAYVSVSQTIVDQQHIMLQSGPASQYDHVKPIVKGMPRLQALWAQKGWVAFDEMVFYLQDIHPVDTTRITKPMDLRFPANNGLIITEWILQSLEDCLPQSNATVMTACLFNDHWFPVKLHIHDDTFTITTSPDMSSMITDWIQEEFLSEYQTTQGQVMPSQFMNDCGFQTIAWIRATIHPSSTRQAMTPSEATKMRCRFAEFLQVNELSRIPVVTLPMGATSEKAMTELQTLLEQHGVNKARSSQAAQALLQKLGLESIQQTLRAPKPWQDLKSKASQLKPPVRIVLSEELQASIDSRLAAGQPVGRKQNKIKQKQPEVRQISSDQVQIPATVFQQADGTTLTQIHPNQFNPFCKGIACVNISEAMPFLQMGAPLTKEGLGMIVLDHDDPRLPTHHELIRFPATCSATGEPMLILGALFQLGSQAVGRTAPTVPTRLDEVETKCIRALIYKDQTKLDWPDIVAKPVRTLFAESEFQANPEAVVDVWDRQFVSKAFKRCPPMDADIFIVNFRIKCPAHEHILDSSGQAGKYFEPRDNTGRDHDPQFKVVWMPKKSFQEVMIAKQTSVHPTWIVRSGDRLGLRTLYDHAKTIHEQHRPEVDYLSGEHMQAYRVGPLPYGTTKASLAKLYKEWNWEARPGQPLGQNIGHEGVFWSSVAAMQPSHWVYSIEQGDILITPMPSNKTQQNKRPSQGLVASKRTIQSMTQAQSSDTKTSGNDPWLLNDPWSQPSHAKSLSQTQVAAIEATVTKYIADTHKAPKGTDVTMDGEAETRIGDLEAQVQSLQHNMSQLTSNLTQFQAQQQQHNGQVSQQIITVKNQVDAQQSNLQQMIETKMDDQMSRIEALLTKRMRHHE
eukprot:s136_g5.t1